MTIAVEREKVRFAWSQGSTSTSKVPSAFARVSREDTDTLAMATIIRRIGRPSLLQASRRYGVRAISSQFGFVPPQSGLQQDQRHASPRGLSLPIPYVTETTVCFAIMHPTSMIN